MQVLVHYRKQKIESFLRELNGLNAAYAKRSFDFDEDFIKTLAQIKEYFHQTGASGKEAEVAQISLYFETAKKGIHPKKLEKVNRNRRENSWIAAFYCLDSLYSLLINDLESIGIILKEGKSMIGQVLLNSLQSGVLTESDIESYGDLESVEKIWKKLIENEQFKLIHRKLRMNLSSQDIIILADQNLQSITQLKTSES